MRKLIFAVMFFILLSAVTVYAAELCDDLDEQPDFEDTFDSAAKVKYGITDKTDVCLSNRDGYSMDTSRWLREYYCDDDDKRAYKDIECVRYGFDKCEGGKCVGASGTAPTVKKITSPTEACGNKKIEAELGEKCDPPDSICYDDDGGIGICTRPNDAGFGGCQCNLYGGDDTSEETEDEPEEEVDETAEETEEDVPVEDEEESAEETSAAPTEEVRAPLPTEAYNEMKGVSVTRRMTNSVKGFFSWIGSWFS